MRAVPPSCLTSSSSPKLFALVAVLMCLPAMASNGPRADVVSADSPTNWLGSSVAALEGVGRLSISTAQGGFVCSGSLLAGGQYLLTAAHCITNENTGALEANSVTVRFKQGTPGAVTSTASAYYVNPNWKGFNVSAGDGSDLALIKLNTAVTSIQGYNLSTTNDVGKTFMMAGYGLIGSGGTGATGSAPQSLHYGFNVNDTTDYNLNLALRNAGYSDALGFPMYPTKFGETYVYDFDNGNANQNALKRLFGLAGVPLNSDLGLDLGVSEAMIAGGDSGGGDFVLGADGKYMLSGVHSYGWDLCTDTAHGGLADSLSNCVVAPNNANGSSFGSLGGSTAVFSAVDWISSVTAVAEPESAALMLAGLGALGFVARRRRPG